MRATRRSWIAGVLALGVTAWGCSDSGDSPTGPEPDPGGSGAAIQSLVPARTVVGDTVKVVGTGFGAAQEGRDLLFAGANEQALEAQILSWSEEEIVALVPAGTVPGPVLVREEDGSTGEARSFDVAPALVSFSSDLGPIFQRRGCQSCHSGPGGSGGLSVETPASILRGGGRGPAAVPRRSGQSLLLRALAGEGMPLMPFGGSEIPGTERQSIADWIDQGMRAN